MFEFNSEEFDPSATASATRQALVTEGLIQEPMPAGRMKASPFRRPETRRGASLTGRATNLCPKGLTMLCGQLGERSESLTGWIARMGGNLMVVDGLTLPDMWLGKYAYRMDFCLIDGDANPDLGHTIDVCLRMRTLVPDLPLILLSSQVSSDDLTSERAAICDVTLRTPLTYASFARGVNCATHNNAFYKNRRQDL